MIIKNDEKLLRLKCEDVLINEVGPLIEQLEKELNYSAMIGDPGIGLAAPQIGIAKNIAIVRFEEFNINLINCKIENHYDPIKFKGEGCLSFPDLIADTMRYQELYVVDNLIYPHRFIVAGLPAIVVAHELDHLKGVLLPDIAIKEQPKVKLGANEPCYCGSKVKFKRCHGKNR